MLIQEGEAISQGQQLAQLDLSELERERQRAVAALEAAEAQRVLVQKGPCQEDIAAAHQALFTVQVEERVGPGPAVSTTA